MAAKKITHILLVEDEPAHAELARRAFEARGGQVRLTIAKTLAEARSYLSILTPRPALIIADWRLPDGDGMELLEEYRENPAIPAIIMTSHGNERVAVEAMKAGALDYLVKSEVTLMDLPHIAERALREWSILAERSKMESALSRSETLLHTVVSNIPIVLFAIDKQGVFTLSEGKGLSALGLNSGQVMGKRITDVYHNSPEINDSIRRVLAGEAHVNILDVNGATLETWFSPVLEPNGEITGAIGVSTDITARQQTEARLSLAHQALIEAYDATIEGWAHALELRERETAGHSRRVVALTLELARKMGVAEEDLVHLRRGALLHDIGKMGIPDYILLKPGKLTEEEWVIMRQHPQYARKMLSSIEYLHPAIEIPYSHHERWNGSGYPLGLKGKAIPLAARVFAVVDVWDALKSDRPYRPAWTEKDTRIYLQQQAGREFDPRVVELFLNDCLPEISNAYSEIRS